MLNIVWFIWEILLDTVTRIIWLIVIIGRCCHDFLVFIFYNCLIFHLWCFRKAAYLVPSNGQPYNQLAILASGQGDMLSTVFFYLRAIYVKCPFPGSKTNLERTLEKVLKVSKTKVNQKQINKISVLELIRLFLKFHAVIYTTKKGDLEDSEFDELYT